MLKSSTSFSPHGVAAMLVNGPDQSGQSALVWNAFAFASSASERTVPAIVPVRLSPAVQVPVTFPPSTVALMVNSPGAAP